jgi:hypothetical protein
VYKRQVDVSDPGYGRLTCQRLDDRFAELEELDREISTFAGERLAALLDAVTQLALSTPDVPHISIRASRGRPLLIARDEAPKLLPNMQQAVALAVGGEDRFERVWMDPDAPAPGQLCATCNHGCSSSIDVTHSSWCDQYGHTPFGQPSGVAWR